jgi:hypothetical protein
MHVFGASAMGKTSSNKSSAYPEDSVSRRNPASFGEPIFERVDENTNTFHFYIPIILGISHKIKGNFWLFKNFEVEYGIREVLFRLGWIGLKCLHKEARIGDAFTVKSTQCRIPYPSGALKSPIGEVDLRSNHSTAETLIETFNGKLVNDERNEAEWFFAWEHEHAYLAGDLIAQGIKQIAIFEIQYNGEGGNPEIGCDLLLEKTEDKLVIRDYKANTRSGIFRSLKPNLPFLSLSSAMFSLARLIDFLVKGKTLKSIVFNKLSSNGVLSNPSNSRYLRIARLEPDPYAVELENVSTSEKIKVVFYTVLVKAEEDAKSKIDQHIGNSREKHEREQDLGSSIPGDDGGSNGDNCGSKAQPIDKPKLSPERLISIAERVKEIGNSEKKVYPVSNTGVQGTAPNAQARGDVSEAATYSNISSGTFIQPDSPGTQDLGQRQG